MAFSNIVGESQEQSIRRLIEYLPCAVHLAELGSSGEWALL